MRSLIMAPKSNSVEGIALNFVNQMVGSNGNEENYKCRLRGEYLHLPSEIILDILSRLPIESILGCRSVCKTWNNLTRDPWFVDLQLTRANDQPKRIILQSMEKMGGAISSLYLVDAEMHKARVIPEIPLVVDQHVDLVHTHLRIKSSLDGLLCMAPKRTIYPVVIYNPITKEHMVLPKTEQDSLSVIGHQVGIGFDSSIKKYKVVRIYDYYEASTGHESSRCEVITLGESTSWRQFSLPCKILHLGCLGPVFMSGVMCWIINKKNHSPLNRAFLLNFDLTSEKFWVWLFGPSVRAPEYKPDLGICNLQLQTLGGFLVLLEYDGQLLHIWSFRQRQCQQDDRFHLSFNSVNMELPLNASSFRSLVCMPRPNKMLLEMDGLKLGKYDKNNLVEYIPRYNYHNKLVISGIPKSFRARSFIPSFISIKSASLDQSVMMD